MFSKHFRRFLFFYSEHFQGWQSSNAFILIAPREMFMIFQWRHVEQLVNHSDKLGPAAYACQDPVLLPHWRTQPLPHPPTSQEAPMLSVRHLDSGSPWGFRGLRTRMDLNLKWNDDLFSILFSWRPVLPDSSSISKAIKSITVLLVLRSV